MLRLTLTLGLMAFANSATAQDRPIGGLLESGDNYLEYYCVAGSQTRLECKFTQISIRRKSTPKDWPERLKRVSEYEKQVSAPAFAQQCREGAELLQALREGRAPAGTNAAEFNEKWPALDKRERDDIIGTFAALQKVCSAPTTENITALMRNGHEKDMRTCLMMSFNFDHEFDRVNDDLWVQNKGPDGPCGRLYVSSLQRERISQAWTYTNRKIVTIRIGKDASGMCSDAEEEEDKYTMTSERFRGCDYIKFGFR